MPVGKKSFGKIFIGKEYILGENNQKPTLNNYITKGKNRAVPSPDYFRAFLFEIHTASINVSSRELSPFSRAMTENLRIRCDSKMFPPSELVEHYHRVYTPVKILLLCFRNYVTDSFFGTEFMPLDIFKYIFLFTFPKLYVKSSESNWKDTLVMENVWQFCKVFNKVNAQNQVIPHTSQVQWRHPAEIHYNKEKNVYTEEFHKWQKKGITNKNPVRYPNSYRVKTDPSLRPLFSTGFNFITAQPDPSIHLSYIESRKKIYLEFYRIIKEYNNTYEKMLRLLKMGKNILICEVDGPDQNNLDHYMRAYNVGQDFIKDGVTLGTKQNLEIFLNDDTRPFGHGFTIAMLLLEDLEKSVLIKDTVFKAKKIKLESQK